jgi:hypothetical protein
MLHAVSPAILQLESMGRSCLQKPSQLDDRPVFPLLTHRASAGGMPKYRWWPAQTPCHSTVAALQPKAVEIDTQMWRGIPARVSAVRSFLAQRYSVANPSRSAVVVKAGTIRPTPLFKTQIQISDQTFSTPRRMPGESSFGRGGPMAGDSKMYLRHGQGAASPVIPGAASAGKHRQAVSYHVCLWR